MIDAATAVDFGLVNQVVKQGELMEKSIEAAKKIASKGPLAVKMTLFAVKYGTEADLETGLVLESALANLTVASEDRNEGIAALFEKRKPKFKRK
jgi:enoyl-CoA hydratase